MLTKVVPLERNGSNFFSDFSRELSESEAFGRKAIKPIASAALECVWALLQRYKVARTRDVLPNGSKASRGHLARPPERVSWAGSRTVGEHKHLLRVSTLSGGEVFGLVSTECLSADKDPSSPHRDSGVRFQPVPEGRITAPVMGSFTAGAAPGFPRGRGIGWDRAKPPAYNYQVCSRRDALRSSPSSDTL